MFASLLKFPAAVCATAFLAVSPLSAADFSTYRGMRLGMELTAATSLAGRNPGEIRTVHVRPALIQEFDWRPQPFVPGSLDAPDSVRETTLSFFNGALFRIAVTYDRYRVEGMTAEDIIQSISETQGSAATPKADIAYHSSYGETAPVLARWEDADNSWSLIRTGDRSSFVLILSSRRVEALAAAASREADRLDAEEAPRREIEKQQRRDADDISLMEKARSLNKPAFRP